MSHPLSSAHIDAIVDYARSDAGSETSVKRTPSSPNSQRASHEDERQLDYAQDATAPTLNEHAIDLESQSPVMKNGKERVMETSADVAMSTTAAPLTTTTASTSGPVGQPKDAYKTSHERVYLTKQPPSPTFSAVRGSLTAATTRPGHVVAHDFAFAPESSDAADQRLAAALHERSTAETATSPLRVDMSSIPAMGFMPWHSPEGTFTASDAYNMGHITPANDDSDPLLLRSKVVNTDQEIRRRPSQGRRADKRVRNYYERQNTLIENLLKPIAKHASDEEEEAEDASNMVRFLIYLNIVANFVLAGLQLYAAISSLSLSLFATAADSVFDPFANVILNWVHRKSKHLDERKWPIGGSRIENAGNIVYATIMGCVSVVLIVESARDIGSHKAGEINDLYVPSLIAVGIAFITKAVLGVFNYMYRRHSSQLDMLWVDCRNDLFINGFGIFTSAAGAKIAWWIDPVGAIVISLGIITSWSRASYEQFRELCGAAAPVEFLQLCTYNALHIHYQHIEMIDSVKAYHSGAKFVVEVDIVMKPETPLWLSHNVSQDLQDKIEQLPMCERAFVHVDFEVDHRPEHSAQKKVK